MSLYALQKLLRDVNTKPPARDAFKASPAGFAANYDLTDEERDAVVGMDVSRLYALGVHGLILRPFTLIHQMPEPEYLRLIRNEA